MAGIIDNKTATKNNQITVETNNHFKKGGETEKPYE